MSLFFEIFLLKFIEGKILRCGEVFGGEYQCVIARIRNLNSNLNTEHGNSDKVYQGAVEAASKKVIHSVILDTAILPYPEKYDFRLYWE